MQITRAADYAVRVMIHLAGLPVGSRVSRTDLSAAAACPEQFLAKVLQNLTRAGLVISHRGNTGGFELDESRRSASILEVVEAIEGPIRLNLCVTGKDTCGRQGWCPAHCVWRDAQDAMLAVLRRARIDELGIRASQACPPAPAEPLEDLQWN